MDSRLLKSTDALVSALSPACLKEIGLKLSSPDGANYKDLAGMLGFTQDEVLRFQIEGSPNPGLKLLQTWYQRGGATVKVLQEMLKRINREDILSILQEELAGPVYLVVTIRKKSNDETVFEGGVDTFRSVCVKDALRSNDATKRLLPNLMPDKKLEEKAATYQGRHLYLTYNDVTPITDQATVSTISQHTHHTDNVESAADSSRDSFRFEQVTEEQFGTNSDALSESFRSSLNFISNDPLPGYHPEATTRQLANQILTPHLTEEGAYLLRPSQQHPNDLVISVVNHGTVEHYMIIRSSSSQYCIYLNGHQFCSITELLSFYSHHPLSAEAPRLSHPIQ